MGRGRGLKRHFASNTKRIEGKLKVIGKIKGRIAFVRGNLRRSVEGLGTYGIRKWNFVRKLIRFLLKLCVQVLKRIFHFLS